MLEIVTLPANAQDEPGQYERVTVAARARRKYWPSDAIDAEIRLAYRRAAERNDRQAIKALAARIGWPRGRVIARARELCLARIREADWGLEEIAVLREHAHLGCEAIRLRLAKAGFRRTRTAITLKKKRIGLIHADGRHSPTELAKLCGIDAHGVMRWIERGWLKAEKRGTVRTPQQGGDSSTVLHADVQAFVWEHPDEIDIRKVERRWFLNLVSDGRIST